ncbi:MAG: hypothetical protein BGO26_00030 [Actinobacteria bacterium 69-20]|nr:MAG: hypothetical protein BGO26_00030 [Actinobacteria bacterium 69-20]
MDEHEGALARTVAETVDAWLRDPRDGALYMRLLIAVEAWRARRAAGATPQPAAAVDDDQGDEKPGEGATVAPVELSAGIPPLMARLRRLQAEAHAREHPDETANERQGGDGEGPDVASPAVAGG